jgi:hypothetical protein
MSTAQSQASPSLADRDAKAQLQLTTLGGWRDFVIAGELGLRQDQALQRTVEEDLKAEAEVVRAHLADSRPRAAAAQAARKEATLQVENRMLLEQNQALRKDLETARSELRSLRTRDLTAAARGDLAALPHRDPALKELRRERDEAVAVGRCAEADLVVLRRVVQRLMAENTRLLGGQADAPGGRSPSVGQEALGSGA